ncbi:MAG TPA: polysaccharide deacetylase family protein [Candidatus Acidoferrales bacterium]|nr:polysaccharide deacetylase family protein [Candidatus Acidoferrales bacterium]
MRPAWYSVRALLVAFVCIGLYGAYEVLEAPGNQIWGHTLVHGPTDRRVVALTFDDGPNPPYTNRILDVLRATHVHATFFVVGRAAAAYPAVIRRIVREGNVVANHTWDHAHLYMQTRAQMRRELTRTSDLLYRICGVRTRLMRPPFGARDFAVLDEARKEGYTVVMWSVPLPADWEQPGDWTIVSRVVTHVHDGSIIVLHDGNEGLLCGTDGIPAQACNREQDVAATREIIRILRGRGYRFVTIPQLLALMRTADR